MSRSVSFTDQEELIIAQAREPLYGLPQFLDYFLRDQLTGTYISQDEDDYMLDAPTRYSEGRTMYPFLYDEWRKAGKPGNLWAPPPFYARYYAEEVEYYVTVDGGLPEFFWHHGWIPLRWGSIMHYAKQPEHTILGGFGSSKTAHVGMSGFAMCATIPRFRFVCVAPFLSQAKPMYHEVRNAVESTEGEKFVARSRGGDLRWTESPNPRIVFHNGSEMMFLGADRDISKVRSESGDWYVVEQSESSSDLGQVTMELGTRARGKVRGRKRLGRMTFIANSGEAPELWERFEMTVSQPEIYWSYNLTSYDNPHLDDRDIKKLERACGGDQDNINQYMRGLKPVGRYGDFPKEVVARCEDESLDAAMDECVMLQFPGHSQRKEKGIGHILWSLPAHENRDYAVYGDPGTKNPPSRGAGVVLVLDETGFPNAPAELVHFHWVVGNNRITPWLDAFEDAVRKYYAQARAYYEATGDQKNFDEISFQNRKLIVLPIGMSGGLKHGMKLKLLMLMERGFIRWPKNLSPIRMQLSKYDEQKDRESTRLPQDIVTTLMIAANELAKRIQDSPVREDQKRGAIKRHVRGRGGVRRNRTIRTRPRR